MQSEIDAYLVQGAAEGWSPRTVEEYRKRLEPLGLFLRRKGRRRSGDVHPGDLDAYFETVRDRGVRRSTRLKWASTTRQFFAWAAEQGQVLSNPARDLALPDEDMDDLPLPPLEEEEIAALFDGLPRRNVLDLRNRLHLELLYGCGLRIAESVVLNVEDCDLANRRVYVAGKGGRDRVLPMMSGVRGALQDYLALRRSLLRGPDDGALLLSRRGKRLVPEDLREVLRKLNRNRGPQARRIHPHLLRHSIAVHLLRGGADIRHVQEFLGHANLDTTKTYLRLVPGRLKDDYERAMPEIAVNV